MVEKLKRVLLDMDGVLCDFDKMVDDNHMRKPNGKCDWQKMKTDMGSKFWSEMDWMPNGGELFNRVFEFCQDNHLKIGILSAIFLPCGKRGKIQWIKKHCPVVADEDILITDKGIDKWREMEPGDLLIDDTEANLSNLLPGCTGVLYNGDDQDVLKELKLAMVLRG